MWSTLTLVVTMATVSAAIELNITRSFNMGFQCDFCRTMPQAANGWTAHIVFSKPIDSLHMISADIVQTPTDGKDYVITNKTYNGDLNAGEDLCLEFTARTQNSILPEVYFYMEGIDQPEAGGSTVLWELKNMPQSSMADPFGLFNTQSTGRFNEGSLSVVSDPAGGSGEVLRVFYKKGSYVRIRDQRGAQFYSTPTSPMLTMKLTYDIFFSPGFDFVKGGKLPGLFGGTRDCSGGRQSDTCFSTRLMWRRLGDGEVYAYFNSDQAAGLCDQPNNICNSRSGTSLGRGNWQFKVGEWQTIAQRVTLNTPGQKDGQVQVWLNGQKKLDVQNLNFRTRSDLKIEGLFFSTFFGGSGASWAPSADCSTYYKNFVISA